MNSLKRQNYEWEPQFEIALEKISKAQMFNF